MVGVDPVFFDQRIEGREVIDLRVTVLVYLDRERAAIVKNISWSGAMIAFGTRGLDRGDEVIVDYGCGVSSVATVVWVKPRVAGLVFHRRLIERERDLILEEHERRLATAALEAAEARMRA